MTRAVAFAALAAAAAAGLPGVVALGAQPTPAVRTLHPIFAAVPDLAQGDEAHARFVAATQRFRLGPVEVMDVAGMPPPRAPALLKLGRTAVEEKRFGEAEVALEEAVADVNARGAAGLSPSELCDVFLYLGMAVQKADWKDLPGPLTAITPVKARQAYLRAAVLARDRKLPPRQFPPLAVESWRLALEEIAKRPRGSMLVRAPTSALISVDAGALKPGILPAGDLVHGEHWIRVEDAGRRPWAAVVPLQEQAMEIDVPPAAALSLDDKAAASHARRQGAAFALVAELKPGRPAALELRLVDAAGGVRRDGTTLPFPGDPGDLEAAVMRLDEQARRSRLSDSAAARAPAPALGRIVVAPVTRGSGPTDGAFARDPGAWARERWPLLTAVGTAVTTALVLGVMVARDDGR
jgi:hypothetical protein